MEDKDIEKFLKESAEEVKVKDFSERWNDISLRISSQQNTALKEPTTETVLATSSNGNVSKNTVRKSFIYTVCVAFLLIAICLSIALPIVLKKNNIPPKFFNLNDLTDEWVPVNEFYDKIEETDLVIINIDNFEVNDCALLYTAENELVGGRLAITDEADWVYSEIVFYNKTVTSSFDIGNDYKTCDINGINIKYKSELTEEYYTVKVKAVSSNTIYQLQCMALDENLENFFEKIFA